MNATVVTERLDDGLHRTTAPNGCVILSERLPGVRSAAVGIWVRTASAHEPRGKMGVSHLLEHMVFKGTERRSAREVALALEVRGGSLDAFTGRDTTSYQAQVLGADLPLACDVLTDLVRRPLLRDADLQLERNVVLEEIAGVQDQPDDLVFELFAETLWPRHPYGYSILGTPETVADLQATDLRALHAGRYGPGHCVIAAAGHVEHEALLAALGTEGWLAGDTPPAAPARVIPAPAERGVRRVEERELQQVQLVLGTDTFGATDPRRYALAICTNILGGGMSSRLFQSVREEQGLCYAVYAWRQSYHGAGIVGAYCSTQPATAERAEEAIRAEFGRLAREGLPADELAEGKRQLQGQLMLGLESSGARMGRLASVTLSGDRYRPLDAVLAEIDGITRDDIAAVAAEFLDPARLTSVRLGPT
ncbi:MAG: pitrilysin family protein [Gemmatimonadales bacterium]|nr:pitrilysin family protein [Gemmatimonadales bacterium]